MSDSLSVIVPVRNAEATLARHLGKLLDLLPDLTHHFEVVVVDDGSSDQTVELVRDLAREYPQLRLIRHTEPRGSDAAAKTGLQWAQHPTVFIQEAAGSLSPTDLRRLWSLRQDKSVVLARAARSPGVYDPNLLDRLSTWGQSLKKLAGSAAASSIQMIRREGALELAAGEGEGQRLSAVELLAPSIAAEHGYTGEHDRSNEHKRADEAHPDQPAMPRFAGTFLRHLRDLALGE